MKKQVGITIDEITHLQVNVYECDVCKARDFDENKCYLCDLKKDYHMEEASVGLI